MKNSTATILVTLLFTNTLALAEDFPQIKEGLWENVIEEGGKIDKVKQCFGSAQSIKDLFEQSKKMVSGMCGEIKLTGSGSHYSSTVNCDLGITKLSVTSEASGDFSSQYKFSSKSTMTPPMMGNAGSISTGTATYIGPCGPDMKPGDVIMADGKKMNFQDMAQKTQGMANAPHMKDTMQKLKGMDPQQLQQMQKMMQEMMKKQ